MVGLSILFYYLGKQMKKNLILWIMPLVLLAGSQCKKHNAPMPDSMECLINGRPWTASSLATHSYAFTYGDTIFTAVGRDTAFFYSEVVIRVAITSTPGFSLGVPIPFNGNNSPNLLSYFTDSTCEDTTGDVILEEPAISGTVTVTRLDSVHHEFAGTFSATIVLSECADTIKLTDGRFDQYYKNE
jgi:hypothetical protein